MVSEPLEAVDHLEHAGAAASPPDGLPCRGAIAVDEQHGAEEIVLRLRAVLRCRADVLQQLAGFARCPGIGALVGRGLDQVGIGEELPELHDLGGEHGRALWLLGPPIIVGTN